ncbi:MAG: hypothetical protein M1838_001741 [Thelocarpon superellum]|nr:MAG: hypothetical protein M1838_001741 [Thelocarpon superellum]
MAAVPGLLDKAVVLMLNLPPAAFCGIDLLSFTSSPRFHGIKELPAGWHFVFTGATTSLSLRHGVWFKVDPPNAGPAEVLVRKWNSDQEVLVPEKDEVELFRWKANLGSIWKEGLTPYRQSASAAADGEASSRVEGEGKDWRQLTDYITPSLLSRVTGGEWNEWSLTSASSAKVDRDDIPGLSGEENAARPEKELNFLPVNLKQTWRSGAIGRERTEAAKDRSWALGDVIRNYCSWSEEMEIVGEMQLTFLMVLTLSNFSCLEQWKRILNLVFTCQMAAKDRPTLFTRILKLLKLQLQHCNDVEGGLFDLSDEGGVMLKQLLRNFRRGLEDVFGTEESEVKDCCQELETYMKTEYGWDLGDSYVRSGMLQLEDGERVEMDVNDLEGEDERGEFAPVVVDLGEGDGHVGIE